MSEKPIGIFDSGIGGLTVLKAVKKLLPLETLIYFADQKHCPYGNRSENEIRNLTHRCVNELLKRQCKLVVIACNTATAVAIHSLRKKYKDVTFVGLEPAVKPAALASKKKQIGVLATENTLKGNHYLNTANRYKNLVKINAIAGNGLVGLIEAGKTESEALNSLLKKYLQDLDYRNIDYLVLGCTHYPLMMNSLKTFCGPQINIIDSSEAVANQCYKLLQINNLINSDKSNTSVQYLTTGNKERLHSFLKTIQPSINNAQIIEVAI